MPLSVVKVQSSHSPSPIRSFGRSILSGLEFLHGLGLLHRDMTLANVIQVQTEHGLVAKIIDFESAKFPDDKWEHDYRTVDISFLFHSPFFTHYQYTRDPFFSPLRKLREAHTAWLK